MADNEESTEAQKVELELKKKERAERRSARAQVFGAVIKQYRETPGYPPDRSEVWNQGALALRAKIQPSTLSRLERGDVLPDLDTLMSLEDVFGLPPGELARHVGQVMDDSERRVKEQFRAADTTTEKWWNVVGMVLGIGVGAFAAHTIKKSFEKE